MDWATRFLAGVTSAIAVTSLARDGLSLALRHGFGADGNPIYFIPGHPRPPMTATYKPHTSSL